MSANEPAGPPPGRMPDGEARRYPREPRLQRKLLVWLLGPLTLLLLLDAGVAWWQAQRAAHLAYDRALHEMAREIALYVRPQAGGLRLALPEDAGKVLLQDSEDRLFYRVASAAGERLGGDADMPAPRPAPGRTQPDAYMDTVQGRPVRMLVAWLAVPGAAVGPPGQVPLQVQVAETLNKRNRFAWEMLANVMLPQLLLAVLAAGVVWFGVSRGLGPLQPLRRAVSDRSHLDLSPIDTHAVPGEVRPLVDEVNDLMARLARSFEFQNRFVADAAHQLKTPVSGLKAQIEIALRETEPERIRHSLAQLYLSADRLSRLVQQLLALARNEPAALSAVQLQPLDLNALALEVSMDWVPQALKRGIDLGFEGLDRPLQVKGDRDRLRELINNLVDNAILYSQANGRVTVRTALTDAQHAQISVSDDGPHIPVHERERIFQRFHRLLGSHADGSGLGLAIVSEIASLHGARITLDDDSDGVGNTFSVHFPLHQA